MHAFANPARFLKIARPATAWTLALAVPLILAGVIGGLFFTPRDYLQGESVRILYIHVPSAWLAMAGWGGLAGDRPQGRERDGLDLAGGVHALLHGELAELDAASPSPA